MNTSTLSIGGQTSIQPTFEGSKRAYRDLHDYASAHGIPAEALAKSGWQFAHHMNRPALRFSTQTGNRYRFLDGHKPVYINPRGYQRCWYLLSEAAERAQHQPLIFCNGEASTIAGQAHGLAATAITGGEKQRLPENLLIELIQHYPPADDHRILVALDCDTAGRSAAAGITSQLRDAGYTVDALDFGLAEGGDLADFCKLHAGDNLLANLDALPRLQVADLLPQKPNSARLDLPRFLLNTPAVNFAPREVGKSRGHESTQSIYERVLAEVMNRLGVNNLSTNSDGWTIKRIPNPFVNHEHDHRAPACVFNVESGTLYDHKGGHSYTLRELADLLNVEYPDFSARTTIKEEMQNPSAFPLTTALKKCTLADADLTMFSAGVPDAWRAAVAAYLPKPSVVLLERLNHAFVEKQLDPQKISLPDVKALNDAHAWGLTRGTLERGFEGLVDVFFTELDPEDSILVAQSVEKSGGRPRTYVRLLSYAEVRKNLLAYAAPRIMEKYHPVDDDEAVLARLTAKMLDAIGVDVTTATLDSALERAYQAQGERGLQAHRRAWRDYQRLVATLDDHHSTPLPADVTFSNRRDFDALLTRAHAEVNPQRSRKQIARDIGVSEAQVSAVLKRAGIQNEPQFETVTINPAEDTRAQIQTMAFEVRGWIKEIVLTMDDGVMHLTYDPATTPALIDGAMLAGAKADVRVQVASKQRIVRESPLPVPVAKSVEKSLADDVTIGETIRVEKSKSTPKRVKVARREPFTGKSFDPAWVRGQIWLALTLLGWCALDDDMLHNPHTGEMVTRGDSDVQLVQAMLGQRVELTDDLLAFARDELGAIV